MTDHQTLRADITRARLTTAEREQAIAYAYGATPSPGARRALAGDMMGLVVRCARQLTRQGKVLDAEFEDLVQAGALGLLQAIDSWEPDHAGAAKLTTWAAWYIKREMLRENRRSPVVPYAEGIQSYDEGYDVASYNYDVDDYVRVTVASADIYTSGAPSHTFSAKDDPMQLAHHEKISYSLWTTAFETLSHVEYLVVAALYGRELRQSEVADELGLSQQRISQLHASALSRLRKLPLSELKKLGN